MDFRKIIKQALHKASNDHDEDDSTPDALRGLQAAEYIVFLLALSTYIRYAAETTGQDDDLEDHVISKGLKLLRAADAELDSIRVFLESNLANDNQKRMLVRALALRATSPQGAATRALKIRVILNRAGAATRRGIFKTNKAIREVADALSASALESADAALDKLAALPMVTNARLRAWIDLAAETSTSGTFIANPVETGAKEASDQVKEIVAQQAQELASEGEEVQKAKAAQTDLLQQLQQNATTEAKKAMDKMGEQDTPPTKSEVVGLAVAAAVATTSDLSNPRNVPESLAGLDDEQRAAALTDGRVVIAASAGSGKSRTLVSRVSYLIKERKVLPSKIFVTSFNTEAADELEHRIGKAVGNEAAKSVACGTMHSLFRTMIRNYGSEADKRAVQPVGSKVEAAAGRTVQKLWAECFNADDKPVPVLKEMKRFKSLWAGNNISPGEAAKLAQSDTERDAALWYEMYEGLKGSIPGWKPTCEEKAKAVAEAEYREKYRRWQNNGSRGNPPTRRGTTFEQFVVNNRPLNPDNKTRGRVADFDDWMIILHRILKSDAGARKRVQASYDHIMIDEAQDRNTVQAEIFEMMSEHIKDASEGKSIWVVGDDLQSIYEWRSAKPELFIGLAEKENWTTKTIRTNYRCEPEIVEAANLLASHNTGQLKKSAIANPKKARGNASIKVEAPGSDAEAAINVAEEIRHDIDSGKSVSDNAILCRTNKEIHAYETALIIKGVPYARKGVSSFLGSPETEGMLGYVTLATSDDYSEMQKALVNCINRPRRFWTKGNLANVAVEDALSAYARSNGMDIKSVNPVEALRSRNFKSILAQKISGKYQGYGFDKAMEQLDDMAYSIGEMQARTGDPAYKTKDLFEDILALKGVGSAVDPLTGKTNFIELTFRESLELEIKSMSAKDDEGTTGDEPEGDDEDDEGEGLGNISFLFALAKQDPSDPNDVVSDPATPAGFKAKMARYSLRAKELRVDLDKWKKTQKALPPEQRMPPPGVYLGTCHSTKGKEWPHTFVQMPKGKFPMEPKVKPGDPPLDEDATNKQMQSERRLAYVAMTRAAEKLTIVCPASVGGKAAGISDFVAQAGLKVGENVSKPNNNPEVLSEESVAPPGEPVGPTPEEADQEVGGPLKTAGEMYSDEGPDMDYLDDFEEDDVMPWDPSTVEEMVS